MGEWIKVKLDDRQLFSVNPSCGSLPNEFYYIDLESVVSGRLIKLQLFKQKEAPSRAQRLLEKNDILFQLVRPYQQNNLFFDEIFDLAAVASTGYAQIRTTQDKMYLYYTLHLADFQNQVNTRCTGSNYPAITASELKKIPFNILANINEQRKIAEVLATVDEAIDKTQALIEKYKNIKAGMVQDLLGTIDVEKNRLKLSSCAFLLNGDRGSNYPNASDIVSEGCAFINAGHLDNGKICWQECDYITHEKFASLRGAKLQKGDIIYCLRGTLGKNAYVDINHEGTVASSLVVIRAQGINSLFLFYLINSYIEEKQRLANDNGTAQPNLSAKSVGEYLIPIPTDEIQQQITTQLVAVDKKIQTERDYLAKLQDIKRGLMQDLLDPNGVSVDALM